MKPVKSYYKPQAQLMMMKTDIFARVTCQSQCSKQKMMVQLFAISKTNTIAYIFL